MTFRHHEETLQAYMHGDRINFKIHYSRDSLHEHQVIVLSISTVDTITKHLTSIESTQDVQITITRTIDN